MTIRFWRTSVRCQNQCWHKWNHATFTLSNQFQLSDTYLIPNNNVSLTNWTRVQQCVSSNFSKIFLSYLDYIPALNSKYKIRTTVFTTEKTTALTTSTSCLILVLIISYQFIISRLKLSTKAFTKTSFNSANKRSTVRMPFKWKK